MELEQKVQENIDVSIAPSNTSVPCCLGAFSGLVLYTYTD